MGQEELMPQCVDTGFLTGRPRRNLHRLEFLNTKTSSPRTTSWGTDASTQTCMLTRLLCTGKIFQRY